MPEGLLLLAFLCAQRLYELVLSRRNNAILMARGGVEFGAGHYLPLVAFHSIWLLGLVILGYSQPVNPFWLVVIVLLQAVRVWVIRTLGERWTTRIVVLPGEPPVTSGPFRYLRHPNYAVVAAEIAVVPLALGLPWFAAVFFVLHLPILATRIRAEDKALRWAENPSLAKL